MKLSLRNSISKNISLKTTKLLVRNYKSFSQAINMPVIDINKYLNKSEGWKQECKLVSDCLHETGILVIKDPVS